MAKNLFKGVDTLLDKNVRKALEVIGKLLIKEAKQKVPVKTGRLRVSLDHVVESIMKGWALIYGSGALIGYEVPYAKYQEHGTKYIKPVKFLGSSYDEQRKKVDNLINNAVRKALRI